MFSVVSFMITTICTKGKSIDMEVSDEVTKDQSKHMQLLGFTINTNCHTYQGNGNKTKLLLKAMSTRYTQWI